MEGDIAYHPLLVSENDSDYPFMSYQNIGGVFFRFVIKHACDRQTDGVTDRQTDRQNYDPQDRASIVASRGKNDLKRWQMGHWSIYKRIRGRLFETVWLLWCIDRRRQVNGHWYSSRYSVWSSTADWFRSNDHWVRLTPVIFLEAAHTTATADTARLQGGRSARQPRTVY